MDRNIHISELLLSDVGHFVPRPQCDKHKNMAIEEYYIHDTVL